MDQFPQMLYRAGGTEELHGGRFTTRIVADETALSAALAEGWRETVGAALDAAKPVEVAPDVPADDAPPTRDELLQKAAELGLTVDKRWGDARIAAAIAEALRG